MENTFQQFGYSESNMQESLYYVTGIFYYILGVFKGGLFWSKSGGMMII